MTSLLAFSVLVVPRQATLPIQFVPKSQLVFDRKETILESSAGQSPAILLVNDENVSNEALEGISKTKGFVRIVVLVRKEGSGGLTFWNPSGKVVTDNSIQIPAADIENMAPGEVNLILETPFAIGVPKTQNDRPTIQLNLASLKSNRVILGNNRQYFSIQKIGIPKFKFSNIRFSVQVRSFVDTFDVAPGTVKSVGNVNFKVIGLMPDRGDKLEHFSIIQSGYPGMDSLILYGQYDWEMIQRDGIKVKNKEEILLGRLVKMDGEEVDPKEMHWDFPSKRQVKYLSRITVVRAANVQGYFQHIATQPN